MALEPLTPPQRDEVLAWLGVPTPSRTRAWLDAGLAAYARRVPWESASRIVRRARHADADACVAAPAVFWESAMSRGLGGTCFESNAALAALLTASGIPTTLTINDMPPTVACHTALLAEAEGEQFVVDAGFPLYAAVPLPRGGETREVVTRWGTFSATAVGPGRYRIGQHPHPRPLAFELVNRAVTPQAYLGAMRADYGPGGLLLDRVIIKKVVQGTTWRFASGERPWVLERFADGVRRTELLPGDVARTATALGAHFGIDCDVVRQALELVSAGISHE